MLQIQTFIFSLMMLLANSMFAQNTRIVEVDKDDSSLYLEFIEKELIILKVDGVTIPKSEYSKHAALIEKYKRDQPESKSKQLLRQAEENKEKYDRQRAYDIAHDISRDSNDDLAKLFENILNKEDILFNPKKYTLRLTNDKLMVNGNKMPKGLKNKLKNIAFDITEATEKYGFTIKIKTRYGSRSISVSIEN